MTDRILLNTGPSRRGFHYYEAFRCPQFFAWTYKAGLERRQAPELVRGSLVHVGLAHYYARLKEKQARRDQDRYYPVVEAMELAAPSFGQLGAEMLPIARPTVLAYIEHVATERVKVLHVEEEFTTTLSDDKRGGRSCLYTLRPDLICEEADQVWIWDSKCVSAIRAGITTRYTNSGQFLGLRMLGRAMYGRRFGGVVLNALQAAPNCKFERAPIPPSPNLLARFPTIILDIEDGIRALEAEGRPFDEWPAIASEHMCKTVYGGVCQFFDACRFGLDG